MFHKGNIVFHLFHTAHSRKNYADIRETCRKAYCIAGIGTAMQLIKNLLCFFRKTDQISSLDRLHDQDGFVIFLADFIYFPRLNRCALIIQIIELDLDDLDLRIFTQYLIKHSRLIME